jgi:ATP-dependent Lon protease
MRALGQGPARSAVLESYTPAERDYYFRLSPRSRKIVDERESSTRGEGGAGPEGRSVPLRFRVLLSGGLPRNVREALRRADAVSKSPNPKFEEWVENFLRIPQGPSRELTSLAGGRLASLRRRMDTSVLGHLEAKETFLRVAARWRFCPESPGKVIGLCGPAGCGKTTLARVCVTESLGLPSVTIPLAGASDVHALAGHGMTYEGSTYGSIASALISTGSRNPVLVFDEVDKVVETRGGEQVSNCLLHITDPDHNMCFVDSYFSPVTIDLSGCVMIFTFNDRSRVNPLLLDRMTVIEVKGYSEEEKRAILDAHVVRRSAARWGIAPEGVAWDDGFAEAVLAHFRGDKGMRGIVKAVDSVVSGKITEHAIESPTGAPPDSLTLTGPDVLRYAEPVALARGAGGAPPAGMYL